MEKKKGKVVPNKVSLRKKAEEVVAIKNTQEKKSVPRRTFCDDEVVNETRLLALSQIDFPRHSRDYFMKLEREVVALDQVQWVVIAGGLLAGKYLESLLKSELKSYGIRKADDKEMYREEFALTWAKKLDEFLPVLGNDINYHIAVSPKVDTIGEEGGIGKKILEAFQVLRAERGVRDVRLRFDDEEPRMALQWSTKEEIRVLVPPFEGWYSKYVSTAVQRLTNPYIGRAFTEERPVLILVGCTGSGVNVPSYEGIPMLSVPAFHKIKKMKTTESMVGGVVVTLRKHKSGAFSYSEKTHDFRPFVSAERQSLIPEGIAIEKKRILLHLSKISQGFDTLYTHMYGFKIEAKKPEKMEQEKKELKKQLDALMVQGLVVFKPEANHYELTKSIDYTMKTNLGHLVERAFKAKVIAYSCLHVGALKTLYATFERLMPHIGEDVDAIVNCGDTIQGLTHGFEYNGELVPTLSTYDSQAYKAAQLHAWVLLDIFDRRRKKLGDFSSDPTQLIDKFLVKFVYCLGNHDRWKHYQKGGLILVDFHEKLVALLMEGIAQRLPNVLYETLGQSIQDKVIRVGEKELVYINNIGIVVTHPHKGGGETQSASIQQVIHQHAAKKHPDKFTLALVGNFHKAAVAHEPVHGRTYVGVKLGAFLKDTQFEKYINKVVDHGPVKVSLCVDSKTGKLLQDEVEFFDDIIHPIDRKIVDADRITEEMVANLAKYLTKYGNLLWR